MKISKLAEPFEKSGTILLAESNQSSSRFLSAIRSRTEYCFLKRDAHTLIYFVRRNNSSDCSDCEGALYARYVQLETSMLLEAHTIAFRRNSIRPDFASINIYIHIRSRISCALAESFKRARPVKTGEGRNR